MKRMIGKLFILSVTALVIKYLVFTPIDHNDPNDAIVRTIEAFLALIASVVFAIWYDLRSSRRKRDEQFLENLKYREKQSQLNGGSSSSAIVMTVVAAVCIGGMVFFVVVVGPAITAFIAIPGVTVAILTTAALLRRVSR